MTAQQTFSGLQRFFKTTAFRLSLIYVAFFSVAVFLAVAYIYFNTAVLLSRQLDQTVGAELQGLAEQYRSGGITRLSAVIAQRAQTPGSSLYFVADNFGNRIAGNLRSVSPELMDTKGRVTFTYRRPLGGRTESRAAYASVIKLADGFTLIVGRDIEDRKAFERRTQNALFWALGLILLGGLAGAWWVSQKILDRIDAVTATTQTIMAGDLSGRLPVSGADDELDRLSGELNTMLDRIEHLMAGLREVSHNIAHDLRTPLNRLRNRVEGALQTGDGAGAHREALEKTIEEADGLIKTFNALLSIARLEAGAADRDMREVDLAEIIRDVAELYEPAAEEQGMRLKIAGLGSLKVKGDRQLLGQAVANLIDNALKYGAPETQPQAVLEAAGTGHGMAAPEMPNVVSRPEITLEVRHSAKPPDAAEIVVSDRGPGVAPAERERALKRFTRLDASRSRPGSGLGLSLVNAVATRHEGSVRLEDNAPGLRVVISLPV